MKREQRKTETISAVQTIPEEHSPADEVEGPGQGLTEGSRFEEGILEELKAVRIDVRAINDRAATDIGVGVQQTLV